MTKNSYKLRYIIFILTVIITIVANEYILRHNLGLQDSDAEIVNIAGRQRMLSQRISKHLLFLDSDRYNQNKEYTLDSLTMLVNEFEKAKIFLSSTEQNENNNDTIKKLFEVNDPAAKTIISASRKVIESPRDPVLEQAIVAIADVELFFLNNMESIVGEYQKVAERNLERTKNMALLLSIVSIAVLLGEFIFIIIPFFTELFKKNKELEFANRKLSDFAHIASHNLRAPLSNLNSLLYFHKESQDPEDKQDLVDKFEIVVENLNDTMNTLIESLKVRSAGVEDVKTIYFGAVLEHTKAIISNLLVETNAQINSDFEEVPSIVYNPIYMDSIFLNLLTNAIKYKSESRSPVIHIKTYRKNGKNVLSFQDNGLGINMERHGEKLFGLNKTFHKHPDAKGVGLFMTNVQIESMGGSISAESKVDEGTLFTIIF